MKVLRWLVVAWSTALVLAPSAFAQEGYQLPGVDVPYSAPAPRGPLPLDLPPLGVAPDELLTPMSEETGSDSVAWFGITQPWSISFELGVNGNEGNSDTLNITSGLDLEQKIETITNSVRFRYNQATAAGIETKNNGILKLGHERDIVDTPWSIFARNDYIFDRFQAFDLRLVLNAGLGYAFIRDDVTTFKGRFGAGTSREFGGPDDEWAPELVLGLDYKRQLTKRQKLTAIVDYYPQIDAFEDFRLITDVSWELLVDEEANLSLKLSVLDLYDSTPNGAKPNDLNYAMLLLWKL